MASLTNRAILTATMVLTLVSPGAWATAPAQEASCRTFVQGFYNWYIASSKKGGADSKHIAICLLFAVKSLIFLRVLA